MSHCLIASSVHQLIGVIPCCLKLFVLDRHGHDPFSDADFLIVAAVMLIIAIMGMAAKYYRMYPGSMLHKIMMQIPWQDSGRQ